MKYFVLIIGLSSAWLQLNGMTLSEKLIKAKQTEFACDLYSPIELFSIATNNSESPEAEVMKQLEALTLDDKTSYLSFLESLDQLDLRMVRLNKKQLLAHLKLGAPIKKFDIKILDDPSLSLTDLKLIMEKYRGYISQQPFFKSADSETPEANVRLLIHWPLSNIKYLWLINILPTDLANTALVRASTDQNQRLLQALKIDKRLEEASPFDLERLIENPGFDILFLILGKLNDKTVLALALTNKHFFKAVARYWNPQIDL